MAKVETLAWFDGDILPIQEIRVSPLAHSLHYGTGVFEGLRCYAQQGGGGGIFRLKDHLARLFDSARILGYEIPFSAEELAQAARDVLRKTAWTRPTCARSCGSAKGRWASPAGPTRCTS